MDSRLLAAAYDRSAEGYDERFRELQRVKFCAAAPFLEGAAAGLCLDAGAGTALLLEWLEEERHPLAGARRAGSLVRLAKGIECAADEENGHGLSGALRHPQHGGADYQPRAEHRGRLRLLPAAARGGRAPRHEALHAGPARWRDHPGGGAR